MNKPSEAKANLEGKNMAKKNKPEKANNKIIINPNLPGDRDAITPNEYDVSRASPVNEALSVIQRIHRAQVLKRIQPRLKQARKLAAHRIATEDKIKKRALIRARKILRDRIVGRTGISYENMDPGQKIRIDTELEKRVNLIKRIAQRIIPAVRKAEKERFASFTHKDMVTHGQHGTPTKIKVVEAYDKLDGAEDQEHTTRYKKVVIVGRDGKKRAVTRAVNVKSLQEKALANLRAKSENTGIPMGDILNTFKKGLAEHKDSKYLHLSPEQYAFACVNKYISENCSPAVRRFKKKTKETINELSNDTLLKYGQKAKLEADYAKHSEGALWPFFKDERKKQKKILQKRTRGLKMAEKKYNSRIDQ